MKNQTSKTINTRSAMKNFVDNCSTTLLNLVGKALEPLSNAIENRVEMICQVSKPNYEVDFSDYLQGNSSATMKSK